MIEVKTIYNHFGITNDELDILLSYKQNNEIFQIRKLELNRQNCNGLYYIIYVSELTFYIMKATIDTAIIIEKNFETLITESDMEIVNLSLMDSNVKESYIFRVYHLDEINEIVLLYVFDKNTSRYNLSLFEKEEDEYSYGLIISAMNLDIINKTI